MVVGAAGRCRENARSCDVSSAARRGSALDLLDRVHARLALHLPRQDAGVAGDDRHEVVEVVRDAAREAPERLQALGLAELLRQSLGLGHVADDQRGRGDLAVLVADGNAETA